MNVAFGCEPSVNARFDMADEPRESRIFSEGRSCSLPVRPRQPQFRRVMSSGNSRFSSSYPLTFLSLPLFSLCLVSLPIRFQYWNKNVVKLGKFYDVLVPI